MLREEVLKQKFGTRGALASFGGRRWSIWLGDRGSNAALAVLRPEPAAARANVGFAFRRLLLAEAALFETPSFGELVAAVGKFVLGSASIGGLNFDMPLLAEGLAVVDAPAHELVALEVVRGEEDLSVLRVHKTDWMIVLASEMGPRAHPLPLPSMRPFRLVGGRDARA